MKKFTTLLTMAFIALMSISFTSCDDDSDIAYTLDGTWKGNMLVEYGNHNALYSVIRFATRMMASIPVQAIGSITLIEIIGMVTII